MLWHTRERVYVAVGAAHCARWYIITARTRRGTVGRAQGGVALGGKEDGAGAGVHRERLTLQVQHVAQRVRSVRAGLLLLLLRSPGPQPRGPLPNPDARSETSNR